MARSEVRNAGVEDAWIALNVLRDGAEESVLLTNFSAEKFGEKAWAQAAKNAKLLSERLVVPYRKRRANELR